MVGRWWELSDFLRESARKLTTYSRSGSMFDSQRKLVSKGLMVDSRPYNTLFDRLINYYGARHNWYIKKIQWLPLVFSYFYFDVTGTLLAKKKKTGNFHFYSRLAVRMWIEWFHPSNHSHSFASGRKKIRRWSYLRKYRLNYNKWIN